MAEEKQAIEVSFLSRSDGCFCASMLVGQKVRASLRESAVNINNKKVL